ncbi:MAG: hypothetical protein RSA49_00205 [Anaerovoracaceae bacterium]
MDKKRLTGDYRKFLNRNYIGEWDLPEKDDLVVTIDHTEQNIIKSERAEEEKPVVYFKEDYKPLILNTTNITAIADALASKDIEIWEGKKISLYRENVRAFGKTTMCVRVRPYAPKQSEYYCSVCGALIEGDGKLSAGQVAYASQQKYGSAMCMSCALSKKAEMEKAAADSDLLGSEV